MFDFIVHLVITAAMLLAIAASVRGFTVEGWGPALLGAIVLGVVNAIVRPVMVLLTLPLTILTLGLFLLIVNAVMLWLVAAIVPGIRVKSFGAALIGSILLAVLNLVLTLAIGQRF